MAKFHFKKKSDHLKKYFQESTFVVVIVAGSGL